MSSEIFTMPISKSYEVYMDRILAKRKLPLRKPAANLAAGCGSCQNQDRRQTKAPAKPKEAAKTLRTRDVLGSG
jgi:hypothetical protein